ncbi:hypothetical protein [Burkholderia sp. Se-20378]|uniref:hypothetical protein n=1 Tax=Burkholderia sp. Se-20378 TaxID=2703899 RepID=UPI0019808FAF|nr:hypothetical protein [Burkholderia sp. Se-20378]MBN3772347.1 hypothetical protein [Burkholderia sp. Se-20378]
MRQEIEPDELPTHCSWRSRPRRERIDSCRACTHNIKGLNVVRFIGDLLAEDYERPTVIEIEHGNDETAGSQSVLINKFS